MQWVKQLLVIEVEDNPLVQTSLESVLADQSYRLTFVKSWQAALDAAYQSQPDLILLNSNTPFIDTYNFFKNYRQLVNEHVPVMISVNFDAPTVIDYSHKLKLNTLLTPPPELAELPGLVGRAFAYRLVEQGCL